MHVKSFILGGTSALLGRAAFPHLLRLKFDRDVARLNAGDHEPLLRAYAEDVVLHFNEGDHRWSGEWVGRAGLDCFLRNFTAARIQGRIVSVATSGPLWRLTLWVRFDDHADGPDGERLYANRTVLVLRTRWGKVVDQEDFYVDTSRIAELERRLADLGVPVVAAGA